MEKTQVLVVCIVAAILPAATASDYVRAEVNVSHRYFSDVPDNPDQSWPGGPPVMTSGIGNYQYQLGATVFDQGTSITEPRLGGPISYTDLPNEYSFADGAGGALWPAVYRNAGPPPWRPPSWVSLAESDARFVTQGWANDYGHRAVQQRSSNGLPTAHAYSGVNDGPPLIPDTRWAHSAGSLDLTTSGIDRSKQAPDNFFRTRHVANEIWGSTSSQTPHLYFNGDLPYTVYENSMSLHMRPLDGAPPPDEVDWPLRQDNWSTHGLASVQWSQAQHVGDPAGAYPSPLLLEDPPPAHEFESVVTLTGAYIPPQNRAFCDARNGGHTSVWSVDINYTDGGTLPLDPFDTLSGYAMIHDGEFTAVGDVADLDWIITYGIDPESGHTLTIAQVILPLFLGSFNVDFETLFGADSTAVEYSLVTAQNWESFAVVPEPAMLVSLALGSVLLRRRRAR